MATTTSYRFPNPSATQSNRMQTYKVCLIGDACIGKSKLVNRLVGYKTKRKYVPTTCMEVHPWKTPYGTLYNIWDMAGFDTLRGMYDSCYLGCDHVFVMWDGVSYPSRWISECQERHIPYTLVPNTDMSLPNIQY